MSAAAKKPTSKSAVQVFCRIRPTNSRELASGAYTCVKYGEGNIEIKTEENGENKFNFDRVFGMESIQLDVFQHTAFPLITDVLTGYNATILAYGQSGTGKTHTMEGDMKNEDQKGIIPRAVDSLFDGVSAADENMEFTFRVSYVEIYLEKIRDLLDNTHVKNNLTIREDKLKGIYIAGVTEEYVTSPEECLQVMNAGAANRAVSATGLNSGSSRSHSVFAITVFQKDCVTSATKSGKLVLVDLAGSEMVKKSNASGQQLEEAKTINKSLSTLGQVINALTDDKLSHVPYRDSKLTRILQDSLGGNSKTALIITVSPSSYNSSESLSTLRFGMRAKAIENKVTVNATRSVEELELLLVRAEKAIDAQTAHIITLSSQLQTAYAQIAAGGAPAAPAATEGESNDGDNSTVVTEYREETEEQRAARLDQEGKIVMDKSQREAEAAAFQRLQETIQQLMSELDEEKQESNRKGEEIKQLNVLLKEKDIVVQDHSQQLAEATRTVEHLQNRCEAALNEKVEAVGELESLRASHGDELAKLKYQVSELEVSLNTLQTENSQLKTEIAEMSGDAVDGANKPAAKKKNNVDMTEMQQEEELASPVPPRPVQPAKKYTFGHKGATAGDGSGNPSSANLAEGGGAAKPHISDDPDRIVGLAERKQLLEEYSSQFANICMQYQLDEQTSAELYGVLDAYGENMEHFFGALEDKLAVEQKSKGKRLRELEEQRHRLEKDLQGRIEAMIQLQLKFDSLSRMNGMQAAEAMGERDSAHLRSLQQRLEQLVAVHRQLLRKFASLELECNELKKKTQLREDRIRQLEGSARGMIGNIRTQAERYVAELSHLREQMQVMKEEHDYRVEQFQKQINDPYYAGSGPYVPGSHAGPRVIGGGGNRPAPTRSLRGGGGGNNRSFNLHDSSSKGHNQSMNGEDFLMAMEGANNGNSSSAGVPRPPVRGGVAVVTAMPLEDEEDVVSAQVVKANPARSSVFSRMLGSKKQERLC